MLARLVFLKFLFQDFPQQVLLQWYFNIWYQDDGLRCQMCLFDSQYCGGLGTGGQHGYNYRYDYWTNSWTNQVLPGHAYNPSSISYIGGEKVLSFGNSFLLFTTILSACSYLFVLDPSENPWLGDLYGSSKNGRDECCLNFMSRFLLFTVTTLPLSTCFLVLRGSVFHFSHSIALHLCFIVPCVCGWISLISGPMCFWLED